MTREVCNSMLARRPMLYTDTLNGSQVLRDDLWAVTTDELNSDHNLIRQYAIDLNRAENRVRRLLSSLKEIYEWTQYKNTGWAIDAKAAIDDAESK